ncbi:MAG: FHA domain-containing protein [Lachnospiraceae bacterium]|jgi:hypothetical protein|nr:FHA domain-containing protein [Lachnospiraceae bacterium]
MSDRRTLDISIVLCELFSIILVIFFLGELKGKAGIVAVMGAVAVIFIIVFIRDGDRYRQSDPSVNSNSISQIVLLNEENIEIACWDIYGKVSIVFGRDEQEPGSAAIGNIDVDLRDTSFAGGVEREHAVMNYYNGEWFLEDLESENGVRVQKPGDNNKYKILPGSPCRIDREDYIYLGFTKLRVL